MNYPNFRIQHIMTFVRLADFMPNNYPDEIVEYECSTKMFSLEMVYLKGTICAKFCSDLFFGS